MRARSPVSLTDEDGFLAIMKELFWINRVASEICSQPSHSDAGPVDLERSPFYGSNSICVMSLMECGRPG